MCSRKIKQNKIRKEKKIRNYTPKKIEKLEITKMKKLEYKMNIISSNI